MDELPNDINQYPLSIVPNSLVKYIKRSCPCIVFFTEPRDPKSQKVVIHTTLISKQYPRVFSYKVGWIGHKNNHQKNYPCGPYDVTVWKSLNKIYLHPEPDFHQLIKMFDFVEKQIMGECRIAYINIILDSTKTLKIKKEIEKNKNAKRFKNSSYLIKPSRTYLINFKQVPNESMTPQNYTETSISNFHEQNIQTKNVIFKTYYNHKTSSKLIPLNYGYKSDSPNSCLRKSFKKTISLELSPRRSLVSNTQTSKKEDKQLKNNISEQKKNIIEKTQISSRNANNYRNSVIFHTSEIDKNFISNMNVHRKTDI